MPLAFTHFKCGKTHRNVYNIWLIITRLMLIHNTFSFAFVFFSFSLAPSLSLLRPVSNSVRLLPSISHPCGCMPWEWVIERLFNCFARRWKWWLCWWCRYWRLARHWVDVNEVTVGDGTDDGDISARWEPKEDEGKNGTCNENDERIFRHYFCHSCQLYCCLRLSVSVSVYA